MSLSDRFSSVTARIQKAGDRLSGYFRIQQFWSRSPSIRTTFVIALLTGALIVVVSTGAQQRKGGATRSDLPNNPAGSTKRDKMNFDVRYSSVPTVQTIAQKGYRNLGVEEIGQIASTQKLQLDSALATLRATRPDAKIELSPVTGALEILDSEKGVTGPAWGRSGRDIVHDFVSTNRALYGLDEGDISTLNFIGESDSPSGLRMVRVEQTINGRPIFQSETRFILKKNGQIVRSLGSMIPQAAVSALPLDDLISPQEALAATLTPMGLELNSTLMTVTADPNDGNKVEINANHPSMSKRTYSKIVYFPVAPGVLIPAWSEVIFGLDGDWYVLVDARDGTLLWRKNIRDDASVHDARFRVYVQADGTTPADNPAPLSPTNLIPGSGTQAAAIAPTIVSMHTAMSATASPNGWIDDCPAGVCTASQTQTIGNNVHAYMDRTGGADNNIPDTDAGSVIDGNGKPTGNPDANSRNRDFLGTTPRDFQTNYLPPPQGGNPEAGQTSTGAGNTGTLAVDQFRRGMLTQLFYVANWYHDKLFALGFDEASANFQQTNLGGMGLGNDRVLAEGQDNTSVDNANFSTPPDGTSGRAQMYRFTGPAIDRDGSLDSEVLIHELTHGTSNRLVGNAAGLLWDPARGMGEGWSDFYALSLLNNTNADDPNGKYASGAYATYNLQGSGFADNYLYGIRRFPYSTDNSVNPMTWADVDDVTNNLSGGIAPDPLGFNFGGAAEVHNTGEIWCLTLWEVRSRIIADAGGANGDVPTGNQTMLQLVTDGLKMTGANPTVPGARDAIIAADCATNACANEQSIWAGFADRGLGYKSSMPLAYGGRYWRSHYGVKESFSVPYLDVVNPLTDVTVQDTAFNGNNNGAIDNGEIVRLVVKLTNPWRAASKSVASATGTLSTSTPGVTILDNTSLYGAIVPQGTNNGDTYAIQVAAGNACGSTIDFTLTTVSSLGTTATSFSLRVGTRSGTDPVVTYTGTPNPALTVLNNQARGVQHSISVSDDFEIADLDFRINSATGSTGVGDMSFMLRGPTGYGADVVSQIDALNDFGGNTITNLVVDEDIANTAANDLAQATSASAPYTKSWLPVLNAPWPTLVNPSVPGDPVGELGRFDGTSTKGTWTILAADILTSSTNGSSGNGTLGGWSILVTPRHFACTAPKTTAANVMVSGRVLTYDGRPIRGATVTLTDSEGNVQLSQSIVRGSFTFDNVESGHTYILSVSSGRYTFGTQVINVTDNVGGLELRGTPR